MRELFIYWRTAAHTAAAAEHALHQWQHRLCAEHPQLRAGVYRRAEASQGPVTVMEVYSAAAGSLDRIIDTALEQRITGEGNAVLARWLEGARKVEVFERRPPPPPPPPPPTDPEPSPGA